LTESTGSLLVPLLIPSDQDNPTIALGSGREQYKLSRLNIPQETRSSEVEESAPRESWISRPAAVEAGPGMDNRPRNLNPLHGLQVGILND
jgi:hypothetical protein